MTNLLEVQKIHTFIGQFHILEGVSVEVPQGSITVLVRAQWRRQNDDVEIDFGSDAATRRQSYL